MQKKVVVNEVRTPTNTWSGLGFSKSMPESAIKELVSPIKLNSFLFFLLILQRIEFIILQMNECIPSIAQLVERRTVECEL